MDYSLRGFWTRKNMLKFKHTAKSKCGFQPTTNRENFTIGLEVWYLHKFPLCFWSSHIININGEAWVYEHQANISLRSPFYMWKNIKCLTNIYKRNTTYLNAYEPQYSVTGCSSTCTSKAPMPCRRHPQQRHQQSSSATSGSVRSYVLAAPRCGIGALDTDESGRVLRSCCAPVIGPHLDYSLSWIFSNFKWIDDPSVPHFIPWFLLVRLMIA